MQKPHHPDSPGIFPYALPSLQYTGLPYPDPWLKLHPQTADQYTSQSHQYGNEPVKMDELTYHLVYPVSRFSFPDNTAVYHPDLPR